MNILIANLLEVSVVAKYKLITNMLVLNLSIIKVLIVRAFLSNIFLAVFVFLLRKIVMWE